MRIDYKTRILPFINQRNSWITETEFDPFCEKCTLHKIRTNTVICRGNFYGRVLFVMPAPGSEEDKEGFPAIGKTGSFLDSSIAMAGFKPEDYMITNSVFCFPGKDPKTGSDKKPNKTHMDKCKEHLDQLIEYMPNLKYIVAVGAAALKTLASTKMKISNLVADTFGDYSGIPLYIIYHPSYIVRNQTQDNIDSYQESIRKLKDLLDGKGKKDDMQTFVLQEEDKIKKALEYLTFYEGLIALDLETTDKSIKKAKLLGLAFALKSEQGVYLPFRIRDGENIVEIHPGLNKLWINFFESINRKEIEIIGHNWNYDRGVILNDFNIFTKVANHDTMLYSSILSSEKSHKLDDVIYRFLKVRDSYKVRFKSTVGIGNYEDTSGFDRVPLEMLGKYGAKDAIYTYRVYIIEEEMLRNYESIVI